MALKRNERYPGRFSNPTTAHPQGAFKNRSAPSVQDGSYLEQDWPNDWDGFFGRLLTLAGVSPNGSVDTALSSQYYDALKALFLQRTNPFADIKSDGTVQTALENLGLGEGSALPVGVPVPWPSATPPTGWLKCNGAPFSAAQYPKLALVYPSLLLPDLRGEFIRGWDDGRGVDAGRALLSAQSDSFKAHHHNFSFFRAWAVDGGTGAVYDFNGSAGRDTDDTGGNETRPRNIAFNYIVRAA